MIYVFKDGVLVTSLKAYEDIHFYNHKYPSQFPTDSFSYDDYYKQWYVKRTRAHVSPLPEGMIPKELKMCLLLLGIH